MRREPKPGAEPRRSREEAGPEHGETRTPRFNDAQLLAMRTSGRDLLISAGAGTGKTTVLIERVLYKLRREEVSSLDQLLVVTFTEKAAQEMRDRLAAELVRDPALRPHLAQLPRCHISTIDAFCARFLREHFLEAEVEPTFGVLDENGRQEALDDALRRVFHDWYARRSPGKGRDPESVRLAAKFKSMVEMTGWDPKGERLRGIVLRLLAYTKVTDDPEAALDALEERPEARTIEELPFHQALVDELCGDGSRGPEGVWHRGVRLYNRAFDLAERAGIKTERVRPLRDALTGVEAAELTDPARQPGLIERFRRAGLTRKGSDFRIDFPTAPRGANDLPGFRDLHEAAKKLLDHPAVRALPWNAETMLSREKENRLSLRVLVALVREVDQVYALYKRRNGLLDFSDLEVLAARLLRRHGASLGLDRRFHEVLVDEFQDVNALQNGILSSLSPPEGRFRVGDVKQSIYQFRLADPTIFLGETRNRTAAIKEAPAGSSPLLVYLAENHRSRPPVLDFANLVFDRLFRPEEIGSDYDEQRLNPKRDREGSAPVELHLLCRGKRAGQGAEADEGNGGAGCASGAIDPGAAGREPANGLADDDDPVRWTAAELEARFVARLLARLILEEKPPVPQKDGPSRPPRWSDAAVLLRSRAPAAAWLRAFQEAGVPACLAEGGSLFENQAVRDFRSLLSVLDNPRDDVSLTAFLRSPLCGILDSELLRLRLASPEAASCLDAVAAAAYADGPEEASAFFLPAEAAGPWWGKPAPDADSLVTHELRGRLRAILERIRQWRSLQEESELGRFLERLSRETGLRAAVLAGSEAAAGKASLEKFLRLARDYEAERGPSLHGFLQRLISLENAGKGEAAPGEGDDAVVINTIHGAKGLEYPFVIVPQLAWKPPADSLGDKIRIGPQWAGVRSLNPATWGQEDTPARRLLARAQDEAQRAEEVRILYVALTRARERLILVGSPTARCATVPAEPEERRIRGELRFAEACGAIEWIMAALPWERMDCTTPDGAEEAGRADQDGRWELPEIPLAVRKHETRNLVPELRSWLSGRCRGVEARAGLPEPAPAGAPSADLERVLSRIGRAAPFPPLASIDLLKGKYWVTELKTLADLGRARELEEEGTVRWAPVESIGAEEAARIGILYHTALSRLDFRAVTAVELEEQFAAFARAPWWEGNPRDPLLERGITEFFTTPAGQELSRAAREGREIEREVTFSRRWSIAELTRWIPGLSDALRAALGPDAPPEAKRSLDETWVLVQGRIDCLFRTDAGWIVLDWKTDRVRGDAMHARARSYAPQMTIYRDAVEALWGPAAACRLIFVSTGQAVEVEG